MPLARLGTKAPLQTRTPLTAHNPHPPVPLSPLSSLSAGSCGSRRAWRCRLCSSAAPTRAPARSRAWASAARCRCVARAPAWHAAADARVPDTSIRTPRFFATCRNPNSTRALSPTRVPPRSWLSPSTRAASCGTCSCAARPPARTRGCTPNSWRACCWRRPPRWGAHAGSGNGGVGVQCPYSMDAFTSACRLRLQTRLSSHTAQAALASCFAAGIHPVHRTPAPHTQRAVALYRCPSACRTCARLRRSCGLHTSRPSPLRWPATRRALLCACLLAEWLS